MPIRNRTNLPGAAGAAGTTPVKTPTADGPAPAAGTTTPQGQPAPLGANEIPKPNAGGGGMRVGIPGLAMATAQASAQKASLFALREGVYPDAVGLDVLLAKMGDSPQAKATVQRIVTELRNTTGIEPPAALVSAALANPARIADLFVMTPTQMSAGIDALNLAYEQGKLPALPPMPARLDSGFDLANTDTAEKVQRPEAKLEELQPGLWQGDIKNDALSDTAARRNMVTAEVFDRLAGNADAPPAERFAAKYEGGTYTRLDTLVKALRANGHDIEVSFEHRVANFANLKTKAPDGTILDVPAAVLVDTGLGTKDERALLPAVHSEMVVRIKPGPDTKGTAVDATVKWFQGISGTGFFPAELHKSPSWCGAKVSDTLSGDAAAKAIELAGLASDVINASAAKQNLAVGGYGTTGVCNDSVAVVQHATTGGTAAYPLLMRDQTLYAELKARLSDGNHRDDPEYRTIRKSIDALPSDTKANPTAKARARTGGLPWAPGAEPFEHVVTARKLLQ